MFSPWSIWTNYDFKHYFDEDKNTIILYALRTGKGFKWVTTPKIQISNKLFNKNIMAVIQEFYLKTPCKKPGYDLQLQNEMDYYMQ